MKKVLIISLAFPPITNVGVFRITKFCKYLPQAGWQPIVLTQKAREFYEGTDWAPLEEINKDIRIIRTSNIQPFYWWDHRSAKKDIKNFASAAKVNHTATPSFIGIKKSLKNIVQIFRKMITVPDERMAWIPQAFLPGLWHVRKEKVDVIFSSSPSPTNHILGYLLSLFTGLPHVVDFRDLWTLNEVYSKRSLPQFLKKYDRFWEKIILKHSSHIIVVNRTLKRQLLEAYPKICMNKIDYIYNGFDEDDFEKINYSKAKNGYFTIVYAGSLYGHRSPDFFFEALLFST